jgi:hypothetical protein
MKDTFQYCDLEGRLRNIELDEKRWSERINVILISIRPKVTTNAQADRAEETVKAYDDARDILGVEDLKEIRNALGFWGYDVAIGVAALMADEHIKRHVRAQYKLLYILSYEEDRVVKALTRIARDTNQNLYSWSFHKGLLDDASRSVIKGIENAGQVIDWCIDRDEEALFVLKDFHSFLDESVIIRKTRDAVKSFKGKQKSLIFLSPISVLPRELERDVTVMVYPLPQHEELNALLTDIMQEQGVKESYISPVEEALDPLEKQFLNAERRSQLVSGCQGLTLLEARNLFSKAISKRGGIFFDSIAEIIEEKEQLIKKSGFLEFYSSPEKFETVGGLENLKAWLASRGRPESLAQGILDLPPPKGILLVGVPGCGKSLCAKAVATEWNMPLLRLDLGRIFGGLVGESEANLRRSIEIAEAAAPCVLWIDEIEKGFSDAWGGSTGVTSRVFGSFLTWMQEKTSSVFVVATANDISKLPAEFLRKGRFDEIFFLDLPNAKEREEIFRIHLRRRKLGPDGFPITEFASLCKGYSGAEIEQVIISALYDSFERGSGIEPGHIKKSIQETIPLIRTADAEIERIRKRAEAISARHASLP